MVIIYIYVLVVAFQSDSHDRKRRMWWETMNFWSSPFCPKIHPRFASDHTESIWCWASTAVWHCFRCDHIACERRSAKSKPCCFPSGALCVEGKKVCRELPTGTHDEFAPIEPCHSFEASVVDANSRSSARIPQEVSRLGSNCAGGFFHRCYAICMLFGV